MPGPNSAAGSTQFRIEALSEDGRGVVEYDGKQYLVDNVIPGERIQFRPAGKRRGKHEGVVERLIESSPMRVTPRCEHFGVCGGCSLQHIGTAGQVSIKQDRLLEQLSRVNVTAEDLQAPITGPAWGYRRKARLGAKWVGKKDTALVGFRERRNNHVAVLSGCEVLHPSVGKNMMALRSLLSSLDARESVPQIEMAVGSNTTALVFRHTSPLESDDRGRLIEFAKTHELSVFLQSGGPETVTGLWPPDPPRLGYELPEFDLYFEFEPLEFTQVNQETNAHLVDRVVDWLAPTAKDRVLDLFCGLGNFTLPIGYRGANVVGLEGSDNLVAKARYNAKQNNIGRVEFYAVDLSEAEAARFWLSQKWSKLLLDPPRSGAASIIESLSPHEHRHIVYVSCNPVSFARDADGLVNRLGYRLARLSVVDMFPHTNHVESVSLFVSGGAPG